MGKPEREMIRELMRSVGALSFVLAGVMAVLNQDEPDFKDRVLATIQQVSASDIDARAMLNEAIRMVAAVP